MDQLEEELRGNLATNYVSEINWRERWRQIIRGSQVTSFKLVWLHAQYIQCEEHNPVSEDWWAAVPTPIRIKFIGSTSAPITSEARGYPLPSDFAETLIHYTSLRNLSSITRWGIKSGFDCSKSTESCVYLTAADYDDTEYKS